MTRASGGGRRGRSDCSRSWPSRYPAGRDPHLLPPTCSPGLPRSAAQDRAVDCRGRPHARSTARTPRGEALPRPARAPLPPRPRRRGPPARGPPGPPGAPGLGRPVRRRPAHEPGRSRPGRPGPARAARARAGPRAHGPEPRRRSRARGGGAHRACALHLVGDLRRLHPAGEGVVPGRGRPLGRHRRLAGADPGQREHARPRAAGAARPGRPVLRGLEHPVRRPGLAYPAPLADALARSDVNPGSPDIYAEFNTSARGVYYGTDGHPGAGQVDFETIVLHELGHGLGVLGSMGFDPATGRARARRSRSSSTPGRGTAPRVCSTLPARRRSASSSPAASSPG